jgi:hypothetical protein
MHKTVECLPRMEQRSDKQNHARNQYWFHAVSNQRDGIKPLSLESMARIGRLEIPNRGSGCV